MPTVPSLPWKLKFASANCLESRCMCSATTGAQALYAKLGFEPTKSVGPPDA